MECTSCKHEITDTSNYCVYCGVRFVPLPDGYEQMDEIDRAFVDWMERWSVMDDKAIDVYLQIHTEIAEDLKLTEDWLERCESPAERAFLVAAIGEFKLIQEGDELVGDVRLRMQVAIDGYRVDFLINDNNIVEVDGHAYHSSSTQVRRDAKRDAHLRSKGFRLVRITAHRIFSAPEAAMADVRDYLGGGG